MRTYVRYGAILLTTLIIGAILGIGMWYVDIDEIGSYGISFVRLISKYILPIMIVLVIIHVVTGEFILKKIKRQGAMLEHAGDEESDRIEVELNRYGAIGTVMNTVLNVIAILVLSTGYSMEYIAKLNGSEARTLLIAMGIFILAFIYSGYWGVRFVKEVQKIYPDKKGDPSARRFTKEWLESCDEAEQEEIYKAAYKSYYVGMKIMPMCMMLAMLFHLVWNTGIMAVVFVGIIWVVMTVTYNKNCLGT